jgi:DNA-binding CsgD family transcriptional regulator
MLFLFEGSAIALATARKVIEAGGPEGGPGLLQVLAAGAAAALVEGLPELSSNWALRGLESYEAMVPEHRRRSEIAHARDQLVTCHFLHGVQTAAMLDDHRSVIEQYRAMGPIDPLDALMVPGFAAFWRGHLDAAAELFDQGSDMLEMTGLNRRSFSYTHRAALAFMRGRVEEGHGWVARQREVPGGIAGFHWMIERTDALGLAAEGDLVAASALARGAAAEASCGNWGRTVLLHDVVRFGQTSPGVVEALGELAGREESTWLDRTCHRHARAHLEGDAAELKTVSTAFEEGGLDLFAAEAAAHAVAVHRRAGAMSEVERCTDASLRLLAVVGDARTPALELLEGTLDVLTDRERTVARLAGRGLSSKEIAAQLYISVRTVGNQLQSVYAKLGIHDRRELREVYHDGR